MRSTLRRSRARVVVVKPWSGSDPATIRAPTQVGGHGRSAGVRSPGDPDSVFRAGVLVRASDRGARGRRDARAVRRAGSAGCAVDVAVVLGAGVGGARAAAVRAPALPVRRARGLLVARGRDLLLR